MKRFYPDGCQSLARGLVATRVRKSCLCLVIVHGKEVLLEETIIIPMEDAPMHTDEHPVCTDNTCPCHEDEELVTALLAEMFT